MSDYYQFRDETGEPIDYYQLVNDNGILCKEIERLQKRIDKAIEYIKEHTYDDSLDGDGSRLMFEKANGKELLEILEGEEE